MMGRMIMAAMAVALTACAAERPGRPDVAQEFQAKLEERPEGSPLTRRVLRSGGSASDGLVYFGLRALPNLDDDPRQTFMFLVVGGQVERQRFERIVSVICDRTVQLSADSDLLPLTVLPATPADGTASYTYDRIKGRSMGYALADATRYADAIDVPTTVGFIFTDSLPVFEKLVELRRRPSLEQVEAFRKSDARITFLDLSKLRLERVPDVTSEIILLASDRQALGLEEKLDGVRRDAERRFASISNLLGLGRKSGDLEYPPVPLEEHCRLLEKRKGAA